MSRTGTTEVIGNGVPPATRKMSPVFVTRNVLSVGTGFIAAIVVGETRVAMPVKLIVERSLTNSGAPPATT